MFAIDSARYDDFRTAYYYNNNNDDDSDDMEPMKYNEADIAPDTEIQRCHEDCFAQQWDTHMSRKLLNLKRNCDYKFN